MIVRFSGPPQRGAGPRFDRALLRRRALCILRALDGPGELSVHLAKDDEIAALNREYRRRKGPTDVLSFPLLEGPHADHRGECLGDVVIGLEVAARQARRGRRSWDDELARLLIHGVLHLLGHDHIRAADAKRMRAEERRLWRTLTR